jgi:hypothetical protein
VTFICVSLHFANANLTINMQLYFTHHTTGLLYALQQNTVVDWMHTASPSAVEFAFPSLLIWARQNKGTGLDTEVYTQIADILQHNPVLSMAMAGYLDAAKHKLDGSIRVALTNDEHSTVAMVNKAMPVGSRVPCTWYVYLCFLHSPAPKLHGQYATSHTTGRCGASLHQTRRAHRAPVHRKDGVQIGVEKGVCDEREAVGK